MITVNNDQLGGLRDSEVNGLKQQLEDLKKRNLNQEAIIKNLQDVCARAKEETTTKVNYELEFKKMDIAISILDSNYKSQTLEDIAMSYLEGVLKGTSSETEELRTAYESLQQDKESILNNLVEFKNELAHQRQIESSLRMRIVQLETEEVTIRDLDYPITAAQISTIMKDCPQGDDVSISRCYYNKLAEMRDRLEQWEREQGQ